MTDTPIGSDAWARRQDAIIAIECERDRQDSLWPEQAPGESVDRAHPSRALLILTEAVGGLAKDINERQEVGLGSPSMLSVFMEEVGEIATAILEGDDTELRTECTHAAGVLVKWLEVQAAARDEEMVRRD